MSNIEGSRLLVGEDYLNIHRPSKEERLGRERIAGPVYSRP